MQEGLIERFNSVCNEESIVYHLGDFSMSPRWVETVLPRLKRKEIHLVLGNHDKPFRNDPKWLSQYKAWGFTSIKWHDRFSHPLLLAAGHEYVNLCHLPYKGAGDKGAYDPADEERYSDYRLEEGEQWLFHGHSHNPPELRVRRKQIDVGVDANNWTPISLEQLIELM
jgi:calcineurin-like phosphoesterase family protein